MFMVYQYSLHFSIVVTFQQFQRLSDTFCKNVMWPKIWGHITFKAVGLTICVELTYYCDKNVYDNYIKSRFV